jgi:hypothetical protein
MALTVPLVSGEFLMLQYILGMNSINTSMNASSSQGPVLHLFSQTTAVSNTSTINQMTECTSSGYAPITLVSTNWTTTQTNPAGITTGVYSQQTFTFNTNAVAWGYYVTDTLNNLLWLEQFQGAPFSIPDGGGTIAITSKITLA